MSIGIKAGIILTTNQRIDDEPHKDATCNRKAPTRAEFKNFQQFMQQSMQWMQEALEYLETRVSQARRD